MTDFSNIFLKYGDQLASHIVEEKFQRMCFEKMSWDQCISVANKTKKIYPQIAGFVVSVQNNPKSRGQNDQLIILIGFMDAKKKAITALDGGALTRTFFAGTIDEDFIKFLNGSERRIYQLK